MTKTTDYKTLSSELDDILSKLQASEFDVDESVKLYERGMTIVKELEAYLKKAENTVTKVKADWEAKARS